MKRRTLVFIVILLFMMPKVSAAEIQAIVNREMSQAWDDLEEIIPKEAAIVLDDQGSAYTVNENTVIALLKKIGLNLKNIFFSLRNVLITSVFCTIAAVVYRTIRGDRKNGFTCQLAVVLTFSACAAPVLLSHLISVTDAQQQAELFSGGYTSIYCGILISSSRPGTGGLYALLSLVGSALGGALAETLLLPINLFLLTLGFSSSLWGDGMMSVSDQAASLIKKSVSICGAVILAAAAVRKSIVSAEDGLAWKTLHYATSSAVPLVGSAISDTVSSVNAALKVTGNTFGSAGVIGFLSIYLPPLLYGCVLCLVLRIGCVLLSTAGESGLLCAARGFLSCAEINTAICALMLALTAGSCAITISG